jgi:hypothetical protein
MLVPVLAPGNVWFAHTGSQGETSESALSNTFQGRLQADGFAGFKQIYDVATFRKRLAGRRKFYARRNIRCVSRNILWIIGGQPK